MTGVKDALGDTPYAERYPRGPGHARGSATSRAAAASMRSRAKTAREKILDFLLARGLRGATYDEVVHDLGMGAPTVCGRMVELVAGGQARKSDRTRPTRSGRGAVVYVAAGVPGPDADA